MPFPFPELHKNLQIKLLGTWHYSRQYQVWIIFIKGHLCYRFCLYLRVYRYWSLRTASVLIVVTAQSQLGDTGLGGLDDMCRLVKPACCHSDAGTPLHVCLLYCSAVHWQAQGQVWVGYWQVIVRVHSLYEKLANFCSNYP